MILCCERCDARYSVDDDRLGAGRKVRCASCGHTWFQAPVEAAVPQAGPVQPDAPAEPAPKSAAKPKAEKAQPSAEEQTRALRSFGASAPRKPEPVKVPAWQMPAARLGAVALPTALLVAALIGFRGDLVQLWPPVARLYAMVGLLPDAARPGLAIRSVTMAEQMAEGHRTVIVEGELANTGTTPHKVPELHATLAQGDAAVARWAFTAGPAELAPGEAARFHTQLTDAPEGARAVSVSLWR